MYVRLKEYDPSPALRPFVAFFWEGQFNLEEKRSMEFRVIPNGWIELIIHLGDAHCALPHGNAFSTSSDFTLIGLFTRPYSVRFDRRVNVFGIRLKPEAFETVLGCPASEIFEGMTDLKDLAGQRFIEFLHRLREQDDPAYRRIASEVFLSNLLVGRDAASPYLTEALRIIRQTNGRVSITDLAGRVFISPRQLERAFKQSLGLSPKRYMRIARLNEVNRQLEKGRIMNLTGVAYDCGYTDQAHFIRDFRNFTGSAPGVFLRGRENYIVNPRRVAV